MVESETDPGASEGRWREAQRLLDGAIDDGARQRLHRQKVIRLMIILSMVAFGAWVVVWAVIGHRSGHHPQPPVDVPVWAEVVSWSLRVIGLVVVVVGGIGLKRSRQLGFAWRAPTQVLNRAERKQLLQQVRGRRPVVPAQLPLARDLAVRATRLSHQLVWALGIVIMMAAEPFDGSGSRSLSIVVVSLVAVSYGAAAVLTRRDIARARLFLSQHADP